MLSILKKQEYQKIYNFIVVSLIISFTTTLVNAEESALTEIALPAGTRLVIPEIIMREYQKGANRWGRPFNYLSHNYSFVDISRLENMEGEYTFYLPLSRENGKDIGQAGKIALIDIMNVHLIKREGHVFETLYDRNIGDISDDTHVVYNSSSTSQLTHLAPSD